MTRDIYLISGASTAIGTFGGSLKDVPLCDLAHTVVAHGAVDPDQVGQVVMGNVKPTWPQDAYLSRVAALKSGVPQATPAFNANRLCGSGLAVSDLDVIESNEAFAAQACAVARKPGFDPEKVNPNGSGISPGDPVGATGAIITVRAMHDLQRIGGL